MKRPPVAAPMPENTQEPELLARTPSLPRGLRLLLALAEAAAGLTLEAAVAALGEEGRKSHAATVTMLKNMRDRLLVEYELRPARQGRPAGLYSITPAGRALLQQRLAALDLAALPACAPIETGSMRGERQTVVRSTASRCQVPAGAIASVFHLGATVDQACAWRSEHGFPAT